MTIPEFNLLEKEKASALLFECCGSARWVSELMKHTPFASEEALAEAAAQAWYTVCTREDWLEAFTNHPEIGDKKSLAEKFAGSEQSAVSSADDEVIDKLSRANAAYREKFGFIFIVCATGKSAEEMLQLVGSRINNSKEEEIAIAMGEQHKITILRLKKTFTNASFNFLAMSQLTTHVLNTTTGIPGKDIVVQLYHQSDDRWQAISQGITNADGRISDLLPPGKLLEPGKYKLVFMTGPYFERQSVKSFYPEVEIVFTIADETHYHVPLLISPYGYSTYRGS